MIQEKFLTRLEAEISKKLEFPVKGEFKAKQDNQVFLSMKISDAILELDAPDLDSLAKLMDDSFQWNNLIKDYVRNILDIYYSKIKQDIKRIVDFYDHYHNNKDHNEIQFPLVVTGKCTPGVLQLSGAQVFIERIGTHFITINRIVIYCDYLQFLTVEASIGVLLRSCILDSLMILAWGQEKTFISAIVRESFMYGSDLDGKYQAEFPAFADYFDIFMDDNDQSLYPDPKKSLTTKAIKNRLKNQPNAANYMKTYFKYSKYDHYSFIPHLFMASPFLRLKTVNDAFTLIKHALCSLVTLQLSVETAPFYDILGVRMYESSPGIFSYSQ